MLEALQIAMPFFARIGMLAIVADTVRTTRGPADLLALSARIEAMLAGGIVGASRDGTTAKGLLDLSGFDFDKLAALFEGQPKAAAEAVRQAAEAKVRAMAAANPTRTDLVKRLEELVAAYNAARLDTEGFTARLKAPCGDISLEEERHVCEGLTEAELTVFDMLTRPEPTLTKAEEVAVKATARRLLARLEGLLAVRDWHQRQRPRGEVKTTIRQELNDLPEEPYPERLWEAKVEEMWQFVFGQYGRGGGSESRPH